MADLTKTISVIFGGEDKLSPVSRDILRQLDGFGSAAGAVAQPLARVTDGILAIDAALAGLGAAFLAVADHQAKRFEAAQLDLKKVLSDTDPAVETFTATVDALSVTYGQSADVILQGIANFKQAGYTAAESAQLQRDALDLVIAGDLEARTASDLLIATLKGFALPASEATRVIDSLNAVSNEYATDVEQLAIGLAALSPVAKTMGFSFQETEGLLTPVIEIFRSGSEASDALKTGLLKLIDDSKPVAAALESIGVKQHDANGSLRSGRDILADVGEAFKRVDQNQKLFVTSQLVGIEQSARMVQVFDNLGKTTAITAVAMDSQGSAAKEVAIRLESAQVQASRAVVAFENLARAVGLQLLGNVGTATKGIMDLEVAFKRVVDSGGLAPLLDALKPQIDAFGRTLSQAAANLPAAFANLDFSGLLRSLGNVSQEAAGLFEAIFGQIDLSTPEGLTRALQKAVDGLQLLADITDGILQAFRPVADSIGQAIDGAIDSSEEARVAIGNVLGAAKGFVEIAPMLGTLADTLQLVGLAFAGLGGAKLLEATANLGKLAAAISPVVGALGEAGLLTATTAAGYAVGNLLAPQIDALVGRFTGSQSLGELVYDLAHREADLTAETKLTAEQLARLTGHLQEASDTAANFEPLQLGDFDPVAEAARRLSGGIRDVDEALADLTASQTEQTYATDQALVASGKYKEVVNDLGEKTYIVLNQEVKKATQNLDEQQKEMQRAAERAADYQLKLEEIESKERVAIITAQFKFDEAQLEADTQRIEAAFSSINEGIKSTGDVLADLTDSFLKAESEFDKLLIREYLDREQRRRDQEFELQKRLTEAQIEYLNARRERMRAGDTLITVKADGLTPGLEMVFKEILRYTQTWANEQGLEFLLGAGV